MGLWMLCFSKCGQIYLRIIYLLKWLLFFWLKLCLVPIERLRKDRYMVCSSSPLSISSRCEFLILSKSRFLVDAKSLQFLCSNLEKSMCIKICLKKACEINSNVVDLSKCASYVFTVLSFFRHPLPIHHPTFLRHLWHPLGFAWLHFASSKIQIQD